MLELDFYLRSGGSKAKSVGPGVKKISLDTKFFSHPCGLWQRGETRAIIMGSESDRMSSVKPCLLRPQKIRTE